MQFPAVFEERFDQKYFFIWWYDYVIEIVAFLSNVAFLHILCFNRNPNPNPNPNLTQTL